MNCFSGNLNIGGFEPINGDLPAFYGNCNSRHKNAPWVIEGTTIEPYGYTIKAGPCLVTGDNLYTNNTEIYTLIGDNPDINAGSFCNLKSAVSMFASSSLHDIINCDFPVLLDASYMFYGCSNLAETQLNFDALVNATGTFSNCGALLTTANMFENSRDLIYADQLFYNCTSLHTVSEDIFSNSDSLTTLAYAFYNTPLTDFPVLHNAALKNVSYCFGRTNITRANKFADTSNISSLEGTYRETDITTVYSNDFTTLDKCVTLSGLFYGCRSLTTVEKLPDIVYDKSQSSFPDIQKGTIISGLFWDCTELSNIPNDFISSYQYVWEANDMFRGCSSLSNMTIDFSNSPELYTAARLFTYCTSLTDLELNFANCNKLSDISQIILGCTALRNVNINFSNTMITNLNNLVKGFPEVLTVTLDMSNNLSLTTANGLAQNCAKVTDISISFAGCENLTSASSLFNSNLQLSNLELNLENTGISSVSALLAGYPNISNVNINLSTTALTTASRLFINCSKLTDLTLDVSNCSALTDISSICENCSNLVNINIAGTDGALLSLNNASNAFNGCPLLSEDSINNIIRVLPDRSTESQMTINISSEHVTQEHRDLALMKNWVIS